jgi:hypothetical protein
LSHIPSPAHWLFLDDFCCSLWHGLILEAFLSKGPSPPPAWSLVPNTALLHLSPGFLASSIWGTQHSPTHRGGSTRIWKNEMLVCFWENACHSRSPLPCKLDFSLHILPFCLHSSLLFSHIL